MLGLVEIISTGFFFSGKSPGDADKLDTVTVGMVVDAVVRSSVEVVREG